MDKTLAEKLGFFILGMALSVLSSSAQAFQERAIQVGAQTGYVGLLQEVGDRAAGAAGFGAFGQFNTSDELAMELGVLVSRHSKLDHTEINIGFSHDFKIEKPFSPRFDAGLMYISNAMDVSPKALVSSGYGIYLGASTDLDVGRRLHLTPLVRYIRGFEQTVQLSDGTRWKALQDNTLLLLRLGYQFGG